MCGSVARTNELGAVKPNLKVHAENDPDRRVRLVAKEALKQLADAPEGAVQPKVVDKNAGQRESRVPSTAAR